MEVKYDQHFLVDKEILERIVEVACVKKKDIIYEIGPGKGALTKEILLQKPKKLISVEKDEVFIEYLEDFRITYPNFTYIISDGLLEMNNLSFTKLIANIPYSITEPLYKKIIDKRIGFVVLTHGFDFYAKILIEDNRWHYFVNAFYDVEMIKIVDGNKFEPKTKTKSVVLLLRLKSKISKFEEFLQTLFSKRNRKCENALVFSLVDVFCFSKNDARDVVEKMEFDLMVLNKKIDILSNEEFVFIVKKVEKFVKDWLKKNK